MRGGTKGHQERRGSATRCEQKRDDMRSLEVIRGDSWRFEEFRGWHRGLSFRFTFFLRRHWGIRREARIYKEDARRCPEVQEDADARRCEVIRVDTKRCVEIRGWHQGKSFRFIFVLGRHHQDFWAGGSA